MTKINILKVRINNLDRKGVLEEVDNFLRGDSFSQIATINPEFVLEAERNEGFRRVVNYAELGLVDGIGINFALWKKGIMSKPRITGADLIWEVLEKANRRKLKVFLVASKGGMSNWRETRREIRKKYPFLRIYGMNFDR